MEADGLGASSSEEAPQSSLTSSSTSSSSNLPLRFEVRGTDFFGASSPEDASAQAKSGLLLVMLVAHSYSVALPAHPSRS